MESTPKEKTSQTMAESRRRTELTVSFSVDAPHSRVIDAVKLFLMHVIGSDKY